MCFKAVHSRFISNFVEISFHCKSPTSVDKWSVDYITGPKSKQLFQYRSAVEFIWSLWMIYRYKPWKPVSNHYNSIGGTTSDVSSMKFFDANNWENTRWSLQVELLSRIRGILLQHAWADNLLNYVPFVYPSFDQSSSDSILLPTCGWVPWENGLAEIQQWCRSHH